MGMSVNSTTMLERINGTAHGSGQGSRMTNRASLAAWHCVTPASSL